MRHDCNNSMDTKNDYKYDESTGHKGCLMEIQECNVMVTYYKQKVQQFENENNVLVEIASLSPAKTAKKMQFHGFIS